MYKILLQLFIRSHLRFMILALLKKNYFIFMQELRLFKPLAGLFSVQVIFLYYPWVIVLEILRRLKRQ